jgi:hypothetical protein
LIDKLRACVCLGKKSATKRPIGKLYIWEGAVHSPDRAFRPPALGIFVHPLLQHLLYKPVNLQSAGRWIATQQGIFQDIGDGVIPSKPV